MICIDRISATGQGRYALFSGEEFLFSLDEQTLADSGVAQGDVLNEQQLDALRRQSEAARAKNKALDYLARRDHGAGELYRKLCRSYDPDAAGAAVEAMRRLDLLDDTAFALGQARAMAARHKSEGQIRAALREKGVGRETVDQALAQLAAETPDSDGEALAYLLAHNYRAALDAGRVKQVAAALGRRGFSPRQIRQALADRAQDHDPEEYTVGSGYYEE